MIKITYASNDDNGDDTHIAMAVSIQQDAEILFYLEDCRCTFQLMPDKQRIRISRRLFPILGYRSWYGNMRWNVVQVDANTAEIIAEYLRGMDWQCTLGNVDLWESERRIDLEGGTW